MKHTATRILGAAALAAALGFGLATTALAEPAAANTLYEQLGGKPAIEKVIKDFVGYVAKDNRINFFFAKTNIPHLEKMLVEQVCEGTGGPCKYTGLSMKQAHKGMNINTAQFNALVEDLQKAMDANSVPLGLQNQLLAILAPMQPDVVHQ